MKNEQLEQLMKTYEESCAPTALLDSESFEVLWTNDKAVKDRPTFFHGTLFGIPDKDLIIKRLEKYGSAYHRLEPFPARSDGVMFIKHDSITAAISDSAAGLADAKSPLSLDGMDCYTNIMRSGVDGITLFAQSIERMIDNDDSEVDRLFAGIRRSSYKILRNVQNSTLMAKHTTGSLVLNKQSCNLNELCGAICLAAQSICKVPIKINAVLPYEEVVTELDVKLAERALLNILLNSMTYTRDGNQIDLALSQTATQIILTVKDRGAGIKRENLIHVKEPYFSCEPADDGDVRPGLGLGLSIAAIFCHLHGGTLLIDSEFGEGTSVAMSIKKTESSEDSFMASIADYVTDAFSPVYIEMCDICETPS